MESSVNLGGFQQGSPPVLRLAWKGVVEAAAREELGLGLAQPQPEGKKLKLTKVSENRPQHAVWQPTG